MSIMNSYILRHLTIVLLIVSVTLAGVVFLTQSLRFLELVMNSGASSASFWILTFLALPRFFEIILPIALMGAVIFVYNRMAVDSEVIVLRAAGFSPGRIARPALFMAGLLTVFLWFVTLWLSPVALAQMQNMQQLIKASYSVLFFREGVFNSIGDGLTIYVRERLGEGELRGLMIHDNRDKNTDPVTIIAKSGVLVETPEGAKQVLVYDGSRQVFESDSETVSRLNFDRYIIDLPESSPARQRWAEPDERTIFELLDPNLSLQRDRESLHVFMVEANKRLVSPLLAVSFTLIALASLLVGPVDRRGMSMRIAAACAAAVLLQGLFLASYNLSRNFFWGLPLMYLLVLLPIGICGFLLSSRSENIRRRHFYPQEAK